MINSFALTFNGVPPTLAFFGKMLRRQTQGPTSVRHVVHQDGCLVAHMTNENHARNFIRLLAFFMEERKFDSKSIRD